jgi:hypothetical protein
MGIKGLAKLLSDEAPDVSWVSKIRGTELIFRLLVLQLFLCEMGITFLWYYYTHTLLDSLHYSAFGRSNSNPSTDERSPSMPPWRSTNF